MTAGLGGGDRFKQGSVSVINSWQIPAECQHCARRRGDVTALPRRSLQSGVEPSGSSTHPNSRPSTQPLYHFLAPTTARV